MLLNSLQLFHPPPTPPSGNHQFILLKDKHWGTSVIGSPSSLVLRRLALTPLSVIVSPPLWALWSHPLFFLCWIAKPFDMSYKYFPRFFSVVLWLYLETILPYIAWKCPYLFSYRFQILYHTSYAGIIFNLFTHSSSTSLSLFSTLKC